VQRDGLGQVAVFHDVEDRREGFFRHRAGPGRHLDQHRAGVEDGVGADGHPPESIGLPSVTLPQARTSRGTGQCAPKVGGTASVSVPPDGLARRLSEALEILPSAPRISRA